MLKQKCTNILLTDNRQVTNSWPTVNRLSTNCPPTLFSLNWENCQLTVGRLSADRFFWELFFNFSPLIAIAWSNVIPYYLQSQLPWVITQVQDDKICWSLLCKRWLFKRGYNYSYLTEKSALTTFREVAVSERWSLSRGAYTKLWFDFSETHSQDLIFNPFTPLTPVTAHINPCPLCHLWHHQFQTSWKRKRRGRAKERMRTVKGEVKPKNCFDIRLFTHA